MQRTEHPIRAFVLSALAGAVLLAGIAYDEHARAAERAAQFRATVKASEAIGADTLTVFAPGATLIYSGAFDVVSTSTSRVDMHAFDVIDATPTPAPSARVDGVYTVTVTAPEGLGFASESCALVRFDMLAGQAHAYVRCD